MLRTEQDELRQLEARIAAALLSHDGASQEAARVLAAKLESKNIYEREAAALELRVAWKAKLSQRVRAILRASLRRVLLGSDHALFLVSAPVLMKIDRAATERRCAMLLTHSNAHWRESAAHTLLRINGRSARQRVASWLRTEKRTDVRVFVAVEQPHWASRETLLAIAKKAVRSKNAAVRRAGGDLLELLQ